MYQAVVLLVSNCCVAHFNCINQLSEMFQFGQLLR